MYVQCDIHISVACASWRICNMKPVIYDMQIFEMSIIQNTSSKLYLSPVKMRPWLQNVNKKQSDQSHKSYDTILLIIRVFYYFQWQLNLMLYVYIILWIEIVRMWIWTITIKGKLISPRNNFTDLQKSKGIKFRSHIIYSNVGLHLF